MAVVRNSPMKILEVKDAAGRLGLSSDLKKWDKEDVQKWILWAIREYYGLCLDLLEISGRELCDLNIIQFKERVPDLAVFFFNELQIWKKAHNEKEPDENNEQEKIPAYVENYQNDQQSALSVTDLPQESCATSTSQELPTSIDRINNSESISCNAKDIGDENIPDDAEVLPEEATTSPCDDTNNSAPSPAEAVTISPSSVSSVTSSQSSVVQTSPINSIPSAVATTPVLQLPSSPAHATVKNLLASSASKSHVPFTPTTQFPQHPLAMPGLNMLSPISPHLLASTPRLFIPPYAGFPLPFPNSPALMPQSPFRSPLITPDSVHSPHFNSLSNMDALKKNMQRLEKERKKHALRLEKGGEKLKNRRLKKQAAKTEVMERKVDISTEDKQINPSSDSISIPLGIVKCKVEEDTDVHSAANKINIALDKNCNMKVIPECIPQYERQLSDSDPLYGDRGKSAGLINGKKSLKRQMSHPVMTKVPINIEPTDSVTKNSPAATPVAVRQNSYQIPYYQATSLQVSFDRQNSENLIVPKVEITSADQEVVSFKQSTTSPNDHHHQVSPMNLTLPIPGSFVNESYSPITSPSDTEVEGEHPLLQQPHLMGYAHHEIPQPVFMEDNVAGVSYHHSANTMPSPSMSSFGQHQMGLLPDLTKLSSGEGCSSGANQLLGKTPKRRGRPPGTKPMQRPLGPNDIQKGFFRANHLWKFLLEMLEQPQQFGSYIQWLDRPHGVFKIINSAYVASLWGKRKNNGRMTYDKFSRSIRQYYKKGIIIKTKPSKLIYKFGAEFFNPNGP